jgi:cell division protein ZapA
MPQVLVTIDGRSYRLACSPGEEEHLGGLAKFVDGKITEMHGSFRDIGDQRIVVMAALSIADELFEAKRKAEARGGEAEGALSREKHAAEQLASESEAREAALARVAELEAAIAEATSRIEALAETEAATTED